MKSDHINSEEAVVQETSGSTLVIFAGVRRYALFMASVIMGIWFVGRIFEAATHSNIFELDLVYWMGLSTWVLLGVFSVAAAIRSLRDFTREDSRVPVIISWLSFGLLAAAILCATQGYRIASMGLFAIMAGIPEAAQLAFFQLFKFFPATPMLPINLVVAKAMGASLEIEALTPLVWSPSYILIFFVWSLVYGALLLRIRGGKFIKVIHLGLASAGLFIIMTVKSISRFTDEQLIFLQAGAVVLFFMQVLLTYSSIRTAAERQSGENENTKITMLPPSAFKVALFLLITLPILADLGNQFSLSRHGKKIVQELATDRSESQGHYVTTAQISVRSGPALGDEVVGILPKGTSVRALDKKYGWICIGKNRWISSRLLSPRQMG